MPAQCQLNADQPPHMNHERPATVHDFLGCHLTPPRAFQCLRCRSPRPPQVTCNPPLPTGPSRASRVGPSPALVADVTRDGLNGRLAQQADVALLTRSRRTSCNSCRSFPFHPDLRRSSGRAQQDYPPLCSAFLESTRHVSAARRAVLAGTVNVNRVNETGAFQYTVLPCCCIILTYYYMVGYLRYRRWLRVLYTE